LFSRQSYGQLGIGNKERRHTPQLIQTHSPFRDIAALWCTHISVAFNENKKCYVWGRTKMGNWVTPTESNCDSINDAFILYNKSAQVTCQCFVVEKNGPKNPRNKSIHCNVGKINFNTKNIIGRGPTGTCVYKGTFAGKQPVAVKRFDYFDMADNEIKSLVSLHHQNLVRIYAIECDDKFIFRYIAFELMDMKIKECVERKRNGELIEPNDTTILMQISEGLAYLHSQNIIHCNIRPENVFISSPMRPNGKRKAMITDFCLSNQMKLTPLSLRLDDGWIAGEILKSRNNTMKPTIASDVFALGCLFYYVLNGGNHPFGDEFHRKANICDDRYNIEALKNDESFCKYNLIEAMINTDPLKRPPMDAVLKHPMLWDSKTTLSFIGKVSNSLDQERNVRDSPLNKGLEKRARVVIKGDWMQIISQELQRDLQNSSYELLDDVKHSLGTLPENFVSYFTTRFPLLIIHTYIIFQLCKTEVAFKDFYCSNSFTFDFEIE
jgi:serine/threonine-protein kinase/endoribonuclease IRE1